LFEKGQRAKALADQKKAELNERMRSSQQGNSNWPTRQLGTPITPSPSSTSSQPVTRHSNTSSVQTHSSTSSNLTTYPSRSQPTSPNIQACPPTSSQPRSPLAQVRSQTLPQSPSSPDNRSIITTLRADPPTNMHSPPATPAIPLLPTQLDPPAYEEFPTLLTLPEQDAQPVNSNVYKYIRSLSGITSIINMDSNHSEAINRRSFGPAADPYLLAHGYDNQALRLIAIEYDLAQDKGEFCTNIQKHGMSFCEAAYLYDLIERYDTIPDIF
jgi:hypothetical protein